MRWNLPAVLLASLVLIPAAPATAGTLTTQNTCLVSLDATWRHMNIELTGTGSPAPVATGSGLALTGTSARTTIPHYMVEYAARAELLKDGVNEIPAKVWLALAAPGTPQGVQVIQADVIARTTVTFNGQEFQSATPVDVTVGLPDTAWTTGTAAVGFRQAPLGTLPRLPVGPGGGMVTPLGSAFISALVGGVRTNIDCQPGSGEGHDSSTDPAPLAAGAFETVGIDPGAPVIPAPALRKPAVALRTTKLKRTGKRISLALACADAACKGTVSAKYAGGTAAKAAKYSLAAGARKTYKLTLSGEALKSLEKKSLLVNVKITATGGKTITKKLRLKA